MKKKLKTAAVAVGLVSLLGVGNVSANEISLDKVNKIESHLKESILNLDGFFYPNNPGMYDHFRVHALNYELVTDWLRIGISEPDDGFYPITESNLEIVDFKFNGYGNIDILVVKEGNELDSLELNDFTKEHAKAIYKLVVDEFYLERLDPGQKSDYSLEKLDGHISALEQELKKQRAEKISRIEEHLKEHGITGAQAIFVPYSDEMQEDTRTALVIYDDTPKEEEGMVIGLSKKYDFLYPMTISDVLILDYKADGYGDVDEFYVETGSGLETIDISNQDNMDKAMSIYKMIIDEFHSQKIGPCPGTIFDQEKFEEYIGSFKDKEDIDLPEE